MEDLTLINSSFREQKALELFREQANHNEVYRNFLFQLSIDPHTIGNVSEIPFLPISFFKTHRLQTGNFEPQFCFESSGTTGVQTSRHCIKSLNGYLENSRKNFTYFFGDPADFCFLALLPSYLERGNSSLVAMADHFMKVSDHPDNGFFLHDLEGLKERLIRLEKSGQKTILLGVTFALLDFAERYSLELKHTVVMETGGMKGRKQEITREELHGFLMNRLGVTAIHAEYGMTELQSQAYSFGQGFFRSSDTMIVLMRSPDDPFEIWTSTEYPFRTGVINIVDLANSDTMAFIATDDIGRFIPDGSFEILGRVDHADIRGCSLLVV
jgi:phenylacetate-coenzyme A ligase PaaK-like adenylate-forming protein